MGHHLIRVTRNAAVEASPGSVEDGGGDEAWRKRDRASNGCVSTEVSTKGARLLTKFAHGPDQFSGADPELTSLTCACEPL